MKLKQKLLLAISLLTALAAPAQAEPELWHAVDLRVPLGQAETAPVWAPRRLNVFTVSQLAPRFDGGLGVLRFSVGPQWDLSPNASISLLGDVLYLGKASGGGMPEYRLNLEPVWRGSLASDWRWVDRMRLEYRQLPDQQSWRLRNLTRLNWSGLSAHWTPYLANEVFLEYPQGFNQNRAFGGVRYTFDKSQSLDLGLMWRARLGPDQTWQHDAIVMLFFFFSPDDYTDPSLLCLKEGESHENCPPA